MSTELHPEAVSDALPQRRPVPVRLVWLLVLLVALALVGAASVAFGVRAVSFDDIWRGVTGATGTIEQAAVNRRVPRTFLAMVVGGALGLAGAVMQGVTRNPLADPGILGVTTGAALAVVVGIAFFGLSSPATYVWVAIVGAGLASAVVYAIGSMGRGGATPLKLALAGAATSAAFSSLISAVLLPRIEVMDSFRHWQIGGVGGADAGRIGQVAPFLVVGTLLCFAASRGLNAMALGDDVAKGLGVRVGTTRLIAAAGAILLCAGATAVAGPIGFVGLAVPHLMRLLIGVDHRWLLPFSVLGGAILLTAADVVGRLVARPEEIDVGIITAIVGAPVFIWIVRRQKVRAL